VEAVLDDFEILGERDPLAVLQEGSLAGKKNGGQFTLIKMSPNFEITMYLAQATGSCIVTDSKFRWRELVAAAGLSIQGASPLTQLRASMESAEFVFPHDIQVIGALGYAGVLPGIFNRRAHGFQVSFVTCIKGPKAKLRLQPQCGD